MSDTASTGAEGGNAPEGTTPAGTPDAPVKTTEWYESELTRVRNEAASNRVKGNEKANATRAQVTQEFEAKLAESNTAHEVTKVQLESASASLAKLSVALKSGIPVDKVEAFAKLLQGNDVKELEQHAQTLKSLFGSTANEPAVDPSQGRGGSVAANAEEEFSQFLLGKLNK